jgi:phage protein D/phage baseplate assembly protein gpV
MTPIAVLPEVRVEIDSQALPKEQVSAISEIAVREELSAPTMCEITFTLQCEVPRATPGMPLSLWIGDRPDTLFTGEITAVEHCEGAERELCIRAYDSLWRLRKQQPLRVHTEVTIADLAREVAGPLGCTVETEAVSWPVWRRLIQYRQTDFDLLADLSLRCGAYFHLRAGVLRIMTLAGMGERRSLHLGRDLLRTSVEANVHHSCDAMRAYGWAPSNMSWQDSQVASAAIAAGVSADPAVEFALSAAVAEDMNHLTALAAAEMDRRSASVRVLKATAEGDPDICPGARIEIEEFPETLAGKYVVTWARHRLSRQGGFTTEFGTEPPARRNAPDSMFATPAVVTRIDDPEKLGRVCVSLPAIGGLETGWLCILAAGAGTAKGFMAVPDTGDQILALVSAANPAEGVVLGSLYGGQGMPDTGIEGEAVKRYTLRTPASQRMVLDDSRGQVRVENSSGCYLEMLPSGATLRAAGDMTIGAPGKRIVIEAAQIVFRRC